MPRMQIDYSPIDSYDLREFIKDAMEFGIDELKLTNRKEVCVKPTGFNDPFGYDDVNGEFYIVANIASLSRKCKCYGKPINETFRKFHWTIFHEMGHAHHWQEGYSVWLDSVGKTVNGYTFRLESWENNGKISYFVIMKNDFELFKVFKITKKQCQEWNGNYKSIIKNLTTPIYNVQLENESKKYRELPWEAYADNIANNLLKKYIALKNEIPMPTWIADRIKYQNNA